MKPFTIYIQYLGNIIAALQGLAARARQDVDLPDGWRLQTGKEIDHVADVAEDIQTFLKGLNIRPEQDEIHDHN